MKLKRTVAISMIFVGIILGILLVIGLFIPASVLDKMNRNKPTTTSTITSDGKKVTEIVNPNTGEKTVVTTDPKTGQTNTTIISASGQKTTSTNSQTSTSTGNSGSGSVTNNPPSNPNPPNVGTTSSPIVNISISPSSITSGNSATLTWSVTNNPTTCAASGGWSGTKSAAGNETISPSSTTSYTLACSNSAGAYAKSATITVNAPPPACGQPGGTCHLSDITGHNSSSNCRSAINATGAGTAAYAIPSSFLTLHQSQKSITNTLCGKVYNNNLQNVTSDHRNGKTLGGSNYANYINNFYIGPYN